MKLFVVLQVVMPFIRKLVHATRPDSDGGKSITEEELLDLFLVEAPNIQKGLNKRR